MRTQPRDLSQQLQQTLTIPADGMMRIRIDESKLTAFPLSAKDREFAQQMRGVVSIPTTAQSALMNAPLMLSEEISLLRLTFMPGTTANGPREPNSAWFVSPLAPGYKFGARSFPIWKIDPTTGDSTMDLQYMVL